MPQGQQDALASWLLDGMVYKDAQTQLKEKFGVQVGTTCIHKFWQSVCGPRLMAKPTAEAAKNTSDVCVLELLVEIEQPNRIRIRVIPGK